MGNSISHLLRMATVTAVAAAVALSAAAQGSTKVRGTVYDASTGAPLPMVAVTFDGTYVGISTDFDGKYVLETREAVSTLSAELLGYESQTVDVKAGYFNQIDLRLKPKNIAIDQIVVRQGENPALAILKGVADNRHRNNPDEIGPYQCGTYTKIEIDLGNIRPGMFSKKLNRNFGFVWERMDTSAITGKPYLPVMISESTADYYHRPSPLFRREVIKASRISGVQEDYSLAQFTGQLNVNINLYDSFINAFGIRLASPLSETGTLYYKYFLVDSLQNEGGKIYKIRFHPRTAVTAPVLDGEVNIDSATYALTSARVTFAKDININWINNLVYEVQSRRMNDTLWFKQSESLFADLQLTKDKKAEKLAVVGRRHVSYSDFRLGEIPAAVSIMRNNVMVDDKVLRNDETYWNRVRPFKLNEREQGIYKMVDSIKHVPLYTDIYSVVNAIFGGYYETRYIGIGPYHKLGSYNSLEGIRVQMGFRTTTDMSRKIRFKGFIAYGFRDRTYKGGGGVELALSRQPMRKLSAHFNYDALQLGAGADGFTTGSFMGSLLSRGGDKLSMVRQADIRYDDEVADGMDNYYSVGLMRIYRSAFVPMKTPSGETIGSVSLNTFKIGTRFSWNESVMHNPFGKEYLYAVNPVFRIDLTYGAKGVTDDDYSFVRAESSMRYIFATPPFGYGDLYISGGAIYGRVPYTHLKLHEGNGTYFYDRMAFSCMNFYEFASDTWCDFIYEHHFKGFFLGYVPIIRNLKLREVFTIKSTYGFLSRKNNGSLPNSSAILLFPEGMTSLRNTPYCEMGFGVENIARLLRIDCMWRMTHRSPASQNFAINASIKVKF